MSICRENNVSCLGDHQLQDMPARLGARQPSCIVVIAERSHSLQDLEEAVGVLHGREALPKILISGLRDAHEQLAASSIPKRRNRFAQFCWCNCHCLEVEEVPLFKRKNATDLSFIYRFLFDHAPTSQPALYYVELMPQLKLGPP